MDPHSIDTVIYHANCSDGFGAAWSAWKLLGDRAMYVPATHGEPPPDVTGQNVAIFDFAFDNATTKSLVKAAANLIVIDHHKSAMVELHDVACAHFDMKHSGAMLAWNFFHPGVEAPRLIKYIEDRDLWKWELSYSREFAAAFDMVEFKFEEYDRFVNDSVVDDAIKRGSYILAYTRNSVSNLAKKAAHRKLMGHDIAVINSSHWIDELGDSLGMTADAALIWKLDHQKGTINVSLRAQHADIDVCEIAETFGGGGHRRSAGFTLSGSSSIEDIFDRQ